MKYNIDKENGKHGKVTQQDLQTAQRDAISSEKK